MIRPLYKSFIPYILLLLVIFIMVFIMDNYAERMSQKPEIVLLGKDNDENLSMLFSWNLENEIALNTKTDISKDSAYVFAMELFRQRQYNRADEKVTYLLNQNRNAPQLWNMKGLIAIREMKHLKAEEYFLQALELDQSFNEARINLASLYMNTHRHKEAETLYQLAKQNDPNNPGISYNLGLLYTETGEHETSLTEFRNAADLSSGNKKAKALCQLGMVLLTLKDTAAAREILNEAVLLNPRDELTRLQLVMSYNQDARRENELMKIYRLNPASFQANYYLGNLNKDKGLLSKAEYHYKKALEKRPYHEEVMNFLGDLLIAQNRMEEAELVLSGFAVGDTLPQAYFFQAKIASGKGNIDEAIELYRLAISKSNNEYPEAFLNMAILLKQQNRPGEAIESYRLAIIARPNYSLAYFNLALLYTEQDSTERAIDCYQQSIRIDSSALKSWYNLGRLFDDRKNSVSAIHAYEQALQIQPGYTKAMLALANAFLRIESYQTAIDHYLELLAIYPNYSKAWFNLGLAYGREGLPEKAIEAYEKLIEVDPENVRARINLAILYGRNERVDLAISVFEDAMDINMDNPDIRFNLALQYKKLSNNEQAVYQLLQVIELDPGYRKAYDQLLMIFTELNDDVNYEIIAFLKQKYFGEEGDYYETGKRLHEFNQYELALEAYNLARAEGDNRKWLTYWTGKAHLDLKETEEAINWFNTVIQRDPQHKFSLYRLGQAYEMLGEPDRAEIYYTELLKLDQDFKIVHKSTLRDHQNK